MRLFVAIELDEDVRGALRRVVDDLRPRIPLRWVRPENQHLTLKFVGEWPEEKLDEAVGALRRVRSGAIRLTVAGLVVSPNIRSSRVLWAGVRNDDKLAKLAANIDEELARLGIEREQRPFRPHVTLGRVKKRVKPPDLQRAIEGYDRQLGELTVDRFVLFTSELLPTGAVYRKVREFQLAPDA